MATNLGHTALAMDTEVPIYVTFDGLRHLMAGERDLGEFERMVEAGVPNPCDMLDRDRENLDDAALTRYAGAATFLRETEDADHVFSFG